MSQNLDLILMLLIILLPVISNIKVNSNYNKYSKQKNNANVTGSMITRLILDRNGLNHIKIQKGSGHLTDYFDGKNGLVVLSPEVHDGTSISSIAVAAHETGHALQYKEGYSFLKLRTALVPVVNFTSRFSTIFLFLGIILGIMNFFDLGIILLSIGLLFHLVTLPVEYNASKRAKEELLNMNMIASNETIGIKKVLNAAALTYVAGFLAMALQIIRLIALRNRD